MNELETLIRKTAQDAAADAVRTAAEEAAKVATREGRLAPEFLSTAEAALYLDMSPQWLEKARHLGYGPPFVKLAKMVRYKRSALDEWMSKYTVQPPGGKAA